MDDRPITLGIANTHDGAYEQGYNDYMRHQDHNSMSIFNPSYNPPANCEESYKAGWEAARRKSLMGKDIFPESLFDK